MKTIFKTEEEMIEARTLAIENWLSQQDCDIDLAYFFDDTVESFDDFRERIDDGGGFNIEIIYYSNAIKYLLDNDPSLHESLEIAGDMGYEVRDLTSEILASLLASHTEREKFEKLEDDFNDLFELFEVDEDLEE